MAKQLSANLEANASVSQIHTHGLAEELPAGTRDAASLAQGFSYSPDVDEGVAIHKRITLTHLFYHLTLDLETGMLGTEQLEDPFGNDISFSKVYALYIITDYEVMLSPPEANHWQEAFKDEICINGFFGLAVDADNAYDVPADEGRIKFAAEGLGAGDEAHIRIIVVGEPTE